MKKALMLFLIMTISFAVCGNLICESGEEGVCRDCAMINQNYVCDSFTDAIPKYDPDCKSIGGCYGPDPMWYTYDNGRGENCFPGRCESGVCTNSCTTNGECTSGFCISGTCSAICPESNSNCKLDSASLKIRPVMSTIYLGKPSYVIFALISDILTNVSVTATGPCDLSYEPYVELEGGRGYSIIEINNCKFTGIGSIVLNTSSERGVIHFLSYPTKLYETGNVEGTAGEARITSTIDNLPVEVVVWVG